MLNLLKNKLFIILFTFILLTFVLCTSCFASSEYDFTFEYEGVTYDCTFSDTIKEYDYFIILKSGSNYKIVLTNNKDITFNTSTYKFSEACKYNLSGYSPVDYFVNQLPTISSVSDVVSFANEPTFIASNFDIYDTNGNMVFQGAPQVNQIPEITKALVEQTTQVGMKPLIQIKTLLPIVIATIVGLIGFWKAWQLLSKNLRKA